METHGSAAGLTPEQARAALGEVAAGRAAAADRLPTPWWFHPALGLALGAMVAAFSLPPVPRTAVLVLSVLAQVLLYVLYARLTGVWLNLAKVPSMRRPALLAGLAAYALLGAGAALELGAGVPGGFVLAGVAIGAGYVVFWRWVERALAHTWRSPS